jgi:hypothetical protein
LVDGCIIVLDVCSVELDVCSVELDDCSVELDVCSVVLDNCTVVDFGGTLDDPSEKVLENDVNVIVDDDPMVDEKSDSGCVYQRRRSACYFNFFKSR